MIVPLGTHIVLNLVRSACCCVACHFFGACLSILPFCQGLLDTLLLCIPTADNHVRMVEVLDWVAQHYPELELRIAWNQPMFTHHGTYIVGFSAASKHMAMAPERATMIHFEPVMRERGTSFGKMFARQPWNKPFDYELLDAFIQHQLEEKQDITSFWRPKS